jgi:hypothetical protein
LPDSNICAAAPPAAMPLPDLRNWRRDVPPVGDVAMSSQTNEPGVAGVVELHRLHIVGSSMHKDGTLGRAPEHAPQVPRFILSRVGCPTDVGQFHCESECYSNG